MTVQEMIYLFNRFEKEEEWRNFTLIAKPASQRHDLCALIMLDRLIPFAEAECGDDGAIIMGSSEARDSALDLWPTPEQLAPYVTEEIVRDLVRCGLSVEPDRDGYCRFGRLILCHQGT